MCNQCRNFTWSWVPLASGFVQQNYLFTTFWKLPLPPLFPTQVIFTFWCDFAIHNSFFGGIIKKPFMTKTDQFAPQLLCSSNLICGNIIVVGTFIYRKLFSSGSRIFVGALYTVRVEHCYHWLGSLIQLQLLSLSKYVLTKTHFVPNSQPQIGHLGQEKHSIVCTHQMILQMLFLLSKLFARPSFLPWTCGWVNWTEIQCGGRTLTLLYYTFFCELCFCALYVVHTIFHQAELQERW